MNQWLGTLLKESKTQACKYTIEHLNLSPGEKTPLYKIDNVKSIWIILNGVANITYSAFPPPDVDNPLVIGRERMFREVLARKEIHVFKPGSYRAVENRGKSNLEMVEIRIVDNEDLTVEETPFDPHKCKNFMDLTDSEN